MVVRMQTKSTKRDRFIKSWITLSETEEEKDKKFLSRWAPAAGNMDVLYLPSYQV